MGFNPSDMQVELKCYTNKMTLLYNDLSVKSPFYRIWLQYIVVIPEANIPNTVTLVIKLPF